MVTLEESIREKHHHLSDLLQKYSGETAVIGELSASLPVDAPSRSVEELQTILDEQSIGMEKRSSAIDRQRRAVEELEKLLSLHEGEVNKLAIVLGELEEKKTALEGKNGPEQRNLSDLCRWYSGMRETLSSLTGVHSVEMVRSDYLLVTLSAGGKMVPLHLMLDGLTGRLKMAKVGTTSTTPRRKWKEFVDAAVEFNDVPCLIRSLTALLGPASGNGQS